MPETVIGKTIVIEGEVKSGEDISIEGTIKGKVATSADLFVEESGTVEAEVETRSIQVRGTIVGNVSASDKYELMAQGRVTGDIRAPRVVVSDGATFKGNIDMEERPRRGGEREEAPAPTRPSMRPLKK